MLEVKAEALELLTSILDDNAAGEEDLVRLTANPEGGLALAIDQPRDGDRIIATPDRDVLVVEPAIDSQLVDAVLTVGGEANDQLALQPKESDEPGA